MCLGISKHLMEEMSGLSSLLRHLPTSKASTYMPKWIEQNQLARFSAKSQPSGPIYEWKLVSCIVQDSGHWRLRWRHGRRRDHHPRARRL